MLAKPKTFSIELVAILTVYDQGCGGKKYKVIPSKRADQYV